MGLRHKLLSLWLVLLLLPLTVMGLVGYFYIDSNLRESAIDTLQQVVSVKKRIVTGYLDRIDYLSETFATTPDVIELVTGDQSTNQLSGQSGASNPEIDSDLRALMLEVMTTYESITEIQLIREKDFTYPVLFESKRGNSPDSALRLDKSYFSDNLDNPSFIKYISLPGHRGYLVSTLPILNPRDRSVIGYVAMISTLDIIDSVVNPSTSLASDFFVLDSDSALLTQNSRLPFSGSDLKFARSGSDELIHKTHFHHEFSGDSYALNLVPLGDHLWLGSISNETMVLDNKSGYILFFFMMLSLMLLLSGILFDLVVRRLVTAPIRSLNEATQKIAKGDFKPDLKIGSKDELGALALAFRHMGKQLNHSSKRIRQLAYYDPLTQLPNRTTLRETLSRLLTQSKRNKWNTAVLFIDLDDFKKVNDRLGHAAGDELLIQISERLKNRLRQNDMLFDQTAGPSVDQLISRRGGDEFNAILSSIKAPHDAAVVAERIIQDLNEPFDISGSEIHVGASVGIAIFPDDGSDADTLLRNADLAMYEAKGKGKNNYHIYTSAINKQVHQRLALESALQEALVKDQFRLYYQPKVRLQDMQTVGFEALIRWYEPKQGIILPSRFIPVAEESNLIRDIGNWVLGESMHQIRTWEEKLPEGIRIAINVSARQLAQADLVEQLKMMIDHFQLSPQRLEIELTETSVLHDEVMARQHLTDLRMLGVEISLDDFGTGYSSLNFLRKLPIDTVKIDRSFTANVMRSGETRAIVTSLLNLCRQLNVKSIAEGIETTDQLQFMLEHGCDQGQGFLFSEPLPANEVMVFLEEPSFLALAPDF